MVSYNRETDEEWLLLIVMMATLASNLLVVENRSCTSTCRHPSDPQAVAAKCLEDSPMFLGRIWLKSCVRDRTCKQQLL